MQSIERIIAFLPIEWPFLRNTFFACTLIETGINDSMLFHLLGHSPAEFLDACHVVAFIPNPDLHEILSFSGVKNIISVDLIQN